MDSAPPFFHGDEAYAYPDGFASYEEYVNSNKLPSTAFRMIYDQWRVSLGVSTGYRWSTFLGNLGLGGGLRVGGVYADYDESLYRPFDPLLRRENHRWTPATSIWTSLSLDQRDLTYDPSRGYYGIQRLGYYGILDMEQEHYIRSDTKAEFFVTLLNLPISETFSFKTIFGIHSGLSFIFKQPWYNEPRIEEANRLAVDGMFIGRGWSSEYRNKGLALWENWAELRVPLVPGILAWDFFLDAAGIREDFSAFFNDFNTDFLRFSMGGGLRFTIPQFPFRFSLAKRFKFVDGNFQWVGGPLFAGNDPNSGMDFVISFALSTY